MTAIVWVETALIVCVIASIALSAYLAIRMFRTLGSIRKESARAQSLVENLKHEWDSFNRNQSEQLRQRFQDFEDLARRLEDGTERRVTGVEELGRRTREDLQSLQHYIHEVLEVQLKGIFDSFDSTVDGVLGEMREQLVKGVDRIDRVKAMVDNRAMVQTKLIEGQQKVKELAEATQKEIEREAEARKTANADQ
jgi:hypothetical protein